MTHRPHAFATAAVLLAWLLSSAQATDLGALGPRYPIAEPDLLQAIRTRLLELERSGELKRMQDAATARAIASARTPAPVSSVYPTTQPRRFLVDPSFVLDRDLLGANGERLHAAGTRVNPLDIVQLPARLLFLDGADGRQVAWAEQLLRSTAERTDPVLVSGSWLTLAQRWKRRVFFDQQGRLVRRLGIAQVPALVTQEGRQLRIDELEIPR